MAQYEIEVILLRPVRRDEMSAEEWSKAFQPTDEQGRPSEPEAVPLMIAFNDRRPTHRSLWIRGFDGVRRHIETTAFPLDRPPPPTVQCGCSRTTGMSRALPPW